MIRSCRVPACPARARSRLTCSWNSPRTVDMSALPAARLGATARTCRRACFHFLSTECDPRRRVARCPPAAVCAAGEALLEHETLPADDQRFIVYRVVHGRRCEMDHRFDYLRFTIARHAADGCPEVTMRSVTATRFGGACGSAARAAGASGRAKSSAQESDNESALRSTGGESRYCARLIFAIIQVYGCHRDRGHVQVAGRTGCVRLVVAHRARRVADQGAGDRALRHTRVHRSQLCERCPRLLVL